MTRWLAATAMAALMALAACGTGQHPVAPAHTPASSTAAGAVAESASSAMQRWINELGNGQWGPEWDELIPAQQALIPRDHYIVCAEQESKIGRIDSVRTITTYQETAGVPGTTLSLPSTAVTVEVKGLLGLGTSTQRLTLHAFAINGHWRWALNDVSPYQSAGTCA